MKVQGIIIPEDYKSKQTLIETEIHIKKIKDFFGYDGKFYTNDYTYEELDDFIQNLNPIYEK